MDHTVYKGKVVGLILAIELLKNTQRPQSVSLALNNQVAICASVTSKPGPRQYLWNAFHTNLKNVMQIHGLDHVKIQWTPGHTGIPGNELVDEEAKKAVAGDSSSPHQLPKQLRPKKRQGQALPQSKSAAKQELYSNVKEF